MKWILLFILSAVSATAGMQLRFSFEDSFVANGYILDQTGHGHNAYQFDSTNWITSAAGIAGNAGVWTTNRIMTDGSNQYDASQYGAITNCRALQRFTNATFSAWAKFAGKSLQPRRIDIFGTGTPSDYTGAGNNRTNSTNSWSFGRNYTFDVSFFYYDNDGDVTVVSCGNEGDRDGTTGETTNWHHYAVTVDCVSGIAIAYLDGQPKATNSSLTVPYFNTLGGKAEQWICVGADPLSGTYQWGDDNYPNDAYMHGLLDELRIYDVTLSAAQVLSLYTNPTTNFLSDYYVSKSGSDSALGGYETPWLTIDKAANTMVPTDYCRIGEGFYDETVTFNNHGTLDGWITMDGQGIATNKIWDISKRWIKVKNFHGRNNGTAFAGYIQLNQGAHNGWFENLFIDAGRTNNVRAFKWDAGSSMKPHPTNDASNIVITNCTITGTAGVEGIIQLFGTNNLVIGNKITNCFDGDFFTFNGSYHTIKLNYFAGMHDTTNSGAHMDFFQTTGASGYGAKYITIESNYFLKGESIEGESDVVAIFQSNTFYYTNDCHDIDIRYNVFVGGAKAEVGIAATRWNHNTFIDCATNFNGHTIYFNWEADRNFSTNCSVLNNVFLGCGGDTSNTGWYIWGDAADTITNSWTVNYNYVGSSAYATKSTGASWTTTTWVEANGINGGNPLFLDESMILGVDGLPFTSDDGVIPQSGSPLIGAASDGGTIGAFGAAGSSGSVASRPPRLRGIRLRP